MKKRGAIWIVLTCLTLISLVLASCTTSTSTSKSTSTPISNTTTTISKPTTSPISTPKTTPTTTTTGKWWDSLGKPQYGGEMVIRYTANIVNFDPYSAGVLTSIMSAWMEGLHTNDWTLDPSIFAYKFTFRPNEYVKGQLAESWEFPDPSTYVVHVRKGIHWQDIPPANGREFTADDVVYHYDRLYGLGNGFTKPSPYQASVVAWQDLISVTTTDKYTVVFKWKTPNPESIVENMQAVSSCTICVENPEAIKQWGDVNDWHHAIGTGPFILNDFVSSSSATMVKNPNYWGYDERYPQNKLPYIDKLKVLIIPDDATALAGVRTGKIDAMDGTSFQQAQAMLKSNPEILQNPYPIPTALTVDPRNDVAPFKDIRVRKALQMAIDLPTIAKSYYQGSADSSPSTLTSNYMTGWGLPYKEWPQDLKDEYAYNPTAAKKLLADAGYPNGFKTNIVVDNTADMDLLQVVKSYFANIGIDMEIRPMESAAWSSFVQNGHKHDQMAQRGVANGSLGFSYEPIRQLGKLLTSASVNWNMVADPVNDAFYTKALAGTSIDMVKQAVKDANEYVARQHFVISLLTPSFFALSQPWLKGFNGQSKAISGGSAGATLLYFYPARFWIDQNVKKSMGH